MDSSHFWSATLDKSNKTKEWKASEDEDLKSLQFSHVFLGEPNKGEKNVIKVEYSDVDGEKVTTVLCILQKGQAESMPLQLKTSEEFKLSLDKGNGPIHFIGTETFQPINDVDVDDDDDDDMLEEDSPVKAPKSKKKAFTEDDDDDEDDEEDEQEKVPSPPAKKKKTEVESSKKVTAVSKPAASKNTKKPIVVEPQDDDDEEEDDDEDMPELDEDDDDDEEDDDEMDEEMDEEEIKKFKASLGLPEDDDDDDEDGEFDDEEDDDDDDDDEADSDEEDLENMAPEVEGEDEGSEDEEDDEEMFQKEAMKREKANEANNSNGIKKKLKGKVNVPKKIEPQKKQKNLNNTLPASSNTDKSTNEKKGRASVGAKIWTFEAAKEELISLKGKQSLPKTEEKFHNFCSNKFNMTDKKLIKKLFTTTR